MMKFLLIEDQQTKAHDALACLTSVGSVRHVWSFVEAKRALRDAWADVLVLDMSLPVFSGQQTSMAPSYVYGGEELLKWACPRLDVPPTIVFTQFDNFSDRGIVDSLQTLEERLKVQFPSVVCGAIRYGVGLKWQEELLHSIEEIRKRRNTVEKNE